MGGKTFRRFAVLFASLMILLPSRTVFATDDKPQPYTFFTEWGAYTGFGYADCVQGPNTPFFFIFHMGKDLQRWFPSLQGHKGTLSLFLEPNINPSGTPRLNVDLGLGVGLKYSYPVNDKYSVYILGSVGPHYMSLETQDQAQGFLFADTAGVGLAFQYSPGYAVNFEYRLRHLSNAETRLPNYGIEYHIGLIGFTLFY